MSEFSEGYFLKSNNKEEAVQLLKKAGVGGYVYPERDGWVAFVANTAPLFRFSEKLKAVNVGTLVQFINAEDHGWGFEICVCDKWVCSYYCGINDAVDMDEMESEVDLEKLFQIERKVEEERFKELLKEYNGKLDVLQKYFDENTKTKDILDSSEFAKDMGLYFSDWISYQYAQSQNGEFEKYGDYENLKLVKVN